MFAKLTLLVTVLVGTVFTLPVWSRDEMHHNFVNIKAVVPEIVVEPRYARSDNFMAAPVNGYHAEKVIVSRPVAFALKAVQAELSEQDLVLKIYDGYRPQRAVNHFMRWINDADDQKNKTQYYPDISKADLVTLGYIAEKSGHSRGGSVDVTLVRLKGDETQELDMGSPWDLFDPISHAEADNISVHAKENRQLLRSMMVRHGFKPYSEEWWHFTLEPEPYPNTYFDFPIE